MTWKKIIILRTSEASVETISVSHAIERLAGRYTYCLPYSDTNDVAVLLP